MEISITKYWFWSGYLAAVLMLIGTSVQADETVTISGSRAVLIKPASPRASVILMPGGSGAINPGEHGEIDGLKGNQLVRTRRAYAAHSVSIHAAGSILIS